MAKKRKLKVSLLAAFLVVLIGAYFFGLSPRCSMAQTCVPYVPLIQTTQLYSGNFGSGTQCVTRTVDVPFGNTLTGDALVALQHWGLHFTDSDHHFGAGVVTIPPGITDRPVIVGGGTIVRFRVRACLRDENTDDDVYYEFRYRVAAWPTS